MPPPAEIAFLLGLLLALPVTPVGAEVTQSDVVLIRLEDTVSEDLYAVGNRVDIDGRVEGDLVAVAFDEVRIDGEVTGSVLAVASRVVIAGKVDGSVRVAAGEVQIEGMVGDDAAVAGIDLGVSPGAEIGRDLLAAGWAGRVEGSIGRRLQGALRSLRLAGSVAGDVGVSVRDLVVVEGATVGGDLGYRSDREAIIAEGVQVDGSVIHRRPLPPNVRVLGLGWLARLLIGLGVMGLGLGLILVDVGRVARAVSAIRARPVAVLGVGALALTAPFMLVLVLGWAVTLTPPESAIPLVLILAPVVLGIMGLVSLALLASPIPAAVAIGRFGLRRRSVTGSLVAGLFGLALAALVPRVGGWLLLLAAVFGLGSWMLSGDTAIVSQD